MLWEGHKLKAYENRVLKRILGHKGRGINRRIEKKRGRDLHFFILRHMLIMWSNQGGRSGRGMKHAHQTLDMSKDCFAENLKTEI
jgi:hypothetical protein